MGCTKTTMKRFWIIQSGKIIPFGGEIKGEFAEVPLPLGGVRRWKWPKWYASKADAQAELDRRMERRKELARKLLEAA